jgi:hypothetical protein
MKMVQTPNIVLNNLWVENVTRSKAMKEQLDMFISFDTTLEDIEVLRSEMESFVRHPDNARDFQPDIILEATGIGNMDKLQLKVEIRHKSNWHNETVRAARRSKFMCALVLALRRVPIYAPGGGGEPLGGPTNPGYSVAIDDSWAAEARDNAKKAKEEKRLIPTRSSSSLVPEGELAPVSESKAAENLNARHPAADAAHLDSDREHWNGSHDDQTLNSRDESLDRKQSSDIDDLRQGLLKRESTRGRRKPGESIPPIPGVGGGPGFSVTQASPTRGGFGGVLDEEAELGIQTQPKHSNPFTQGSGYNIYPPPSQGSRGAQQQQQQQQQQQYSPYTGGPQDQQAQAQAQGGNGRLRRLSLGFKPSPSQSAPQ